MKEFNDTGVCVPERHYMVDVTGKVEQVANLIKRGKYFTINRPRQFGKTTIMFQLDNYFNRRDDYIALKISFEGIGSESYQNREQLIKELLLLIENRLTWLGFTETSQWLAARRTEVTTWSALSPLITQLVQRHSDKAWLLMVDEVDKSSNHQIFMDFLGVLRDKYLARNENQSTFQAVILAGVHDIKTFKTKIRPDETATLNSPWNIAIDFTVDLTFNPTEIETMLRDYAQTNSIELDVAKIAVRLYYYTSGYPYLVSKLCKFIDEQIVIQRTDKNWYVGDVDTAFTFIVDDGYTTTLFDSLIKNLENDSELYDFIFQIAINGRQFKFTIADPMINVAHLYGIIEKSEQKYCKIHNRIFEQRIYAYMLSKMTRTRYNQIDNFAGPEYITDKGLDVALILRRFQAFMQEHYSNKDTAFLEREGRLLFLAFLRPIINGRGFEFKEPNVGDERRMDIVITYYEKRYVIELKRWYGPKYHQQGLQQLSDYLDGYALREGYLLIYDFTQGRQYREKLIDFQGKQILAVWV